MSGPSATLTLIVFEESLPAIWRRAGKQHDKNANHRRIYLLFAGDCYDGRGDAHDIAALGACASGSHCSGGSNTDQVAFGSSSALGFLPFYRPVVVVFPFQKPGIIGGIKTAVQLRDIFW